MFRQFSSSPPALVKRLPAKSSRKAHARPMGNPDHCWAQIKSLIVQKPRRFHDNKRRSRWRPGARASLVRLAYFNARPRTGPLFRPRGPEAEMGYEVCYMLRWYPTLGEDFVIVG